MRYGRFAFVLSACSAAVLAAASPSPAQMRNHCDVAFQVGELPEGTLLGFLDFTVEYDRPKIFPPDPQNRLHCTGLVAGSAADATNQLLSSSAGRLTVAFASSSGAAGNTPVVRCDVYSAGTSVPVADDFPVLTVVQARDVEGTPIDPLPVLSVGTVRCGDDVISTTTTTTSTTTTAEPPTTTSTTLPPETCRVRFRLTSGGSFRRLRFDVDYGDAGGRLSAPAAGACESLTTAGLGILHDAAADTLAIELVSVPAVKGPVDLVQCEWTPVTEVAAGDDFDVSVLAASDQAGAPLVGLPGIAASDVSCAPPTTTTTSTTTTTTLPAPVCGDADGDGVLEASDALAALRRAVGLFSACTITSCDVDSNGSIQASDALRILKAAVGTEIELICPD